MKRLLLLTVLLPLSAAAQITVFNWGGTGTVTALRSMLENSGVTHTPNHSRSFSTSPMTPNLSQYFDDVLYGGYMQQNGSFSFSRAAIWDHTESFNPIAGTDTMEVTFNLNNSAYRNTNYRLVVMNTLEESVSFDALSRMTITGKSIGNGSVSIRPIIKIGTQYYIGGTSGFNTSVNTANFGDMTSPTYWTTYDPMASLMAATGGTTMTIPLEGITDVGFLLNNRMSSTNGSYGIAISAMNVTANIQAIPEPSTYALFAAGLAGIALIGRRLKRGAVTQG